MNTQQKPLKEIEDAYPLSMLQAGMLFHSELNPDTAVYHDIFTYSMNGPFDYQVLEESLEELTSRHPVLRTSFNLSDFQEPLQLVHRRVQVPLFVEDLRDLPQEDKMKHLTVWVEEEKKRPFNWGEAPLFRVKVYRFSDENLQVALSFHHSILDGWSVAAMMTELFTIYLNKQGVIKHTVASMPKVKFRDFIALERKAIQSEDYKNYWIQKLQDCSFAGIPRYPAQYRRKGRQGKIHVQITNDISDGLIKLSRSLGIPIKDVLLAAHLRVMSLITGEEDIVTGLVSNGRVEAIEGERVLGLFLNTLPFRMQMKGGTWEDLIQKTFAVEQELIPYRRYPMAEIGRQLNKSPLFESVFNFINFHVYKQINTQNTQGAETESFEQTNFPFSSQFSLDGNNLIRLYLTYDVAEFSQQQMEAIADYFLNTLTAMVNDSKGLYHTTQLLPEVECKKLLKEWSGTETLVRESLCIHEQFDRLVQEHPKDLVIVAGKETLTFQELNSRANQLARYLQRVGVQPDSIIGIYMDRSIEFVVSILGIWKAGAAFLPLDPIYPKERISFILEDTKVPIILTKKDMARFLPAHQAKVISLDRDWKKIKKENSKTMASTVGLDHLAYVIYTSGSTGKPKGVLLHHRGVANIIQEQKKLYGISSNDRVLQYASLGFDASVSEFVMGLGCGARLYLKQENLLLGSELFDVLQEHEITVGTFSPAALASMPVGDLPHLRVMIVAGDVCTKEVAEKWLRGRRLFNCYGPTEATIWATYYECKGLEQNPPIGRPIQNTQLFILNQKQQLVPTGVPGELCIGGEGLARGYINRPDLTQERFILHPFRSGKRLYRTGDLVRYLPDGNIEFLGRIDKQVKIRGNRIELGEIENVLMEYSDVKEVAVLAREDQPGVKQLIAYLVLENTETFVLKSLRDSIKETLPAFMIPSAFVILENLPLTASGKVDQHALLTLDATNLVIEKQYVAPRTPTEKKLVEIWSKVLKAERVGIHDDFFELGGHSLTALQVVNRIRDEFQIKMQLQDLFTTPTIDQLALAMVKETSNQEVEEDIEDLLTELEQLSDEEAEALLEK